jgi:hypothetical protein
MAVGYNPKIVTDGLVTAIDFVNSKSFSPNTFPNGLDIYGWYVPKRGNATGNACTVSRDLDTLKSPVGGIPLRMDVTGNDPHLSSYNTSTWNISTALNGQTWRVSVYAKASQTLNNCEIYIFGANSSGSASIPGGGWYGIAQKTITVTTEWQRFDHFITFNNAEVAFIQMRLDGPNSGGSGTTVWWDGLQVEPFTLTNFNPFYNQNYSSITNLVNRQNGTVLNYPLYNNNGYISLDGIDDQLTINSPLVKDFTLEFWMKSDATIDGRGIIEYGGSTYGIIAVYRLRPNTCSFYFATVGGTVSPSLSKNLADNQWHHVVMTYNGLVGKIYVDNLLEVLVDTGLSGNLRTTSNTELCVGRWRGSTIYQDGEISSVKVYNRELSADEIQQNFNATRRRFGV